MGSPGRLPIIDVTKYPVPDNTFFNVHHTMGREMPQIFW